jgi:hypothetical protein
MVVLILAWVLIKLGPGGEKTTDNPHKIGENYAQESAPWQVNPEAGKVSGISEGWF